MQIEIIDPDTQAAAESLSRELGMSIEDVISDAVKALREHMDEIGQRSEWAHAAREECGMGPKQGEVVVPFRT